MSIFTERTLSDFVEHLEAMSQETRREELIHLLNKTATAAGVNTMSMLWAVVMAHGGSVLVPHAIIESFDHTKIIFGKQETEEGITYTAGFRGVE